MDNSISQPEKRRESKKEKKKKSKKRQRETSNHDIPIELNDQDRSPQNTINTDHIQESMIGYNNHNDIQYINSYPNNSGTDNDINNSNIINNNDNNSIVNTSTTTTEPPGGYKTGKYTKEEDEILWNAIRQYVSERGWTQEEGLNILLSPLKSKDKRLRNAWTQIGKYTYKYSYFI